MSDDERTMRHMLGHPPGTVTIGKPEERAGGMTVWPFEVRPTVTVVEFENVVIIDVNGVATFQPTATLHSIEIGSLRDDAPIATPTIVETREGTR